MQVDVYADVLCPWCYIGKRCLAAALAKTGSPDRVEVRWRSFELAPGSGRAPGPTAAQAMADPSWWGDEAPSRIGRIRALGADVGLDLNLHLARPVNSFDAHRLIQFAATRGRADEMVERLLSAYHTDGADIADPRSLEHLAVRAGLAADDVRDVLAGDAYAAQVRADERRAAEQGVTGVPTLIIGGGSPVSGVQPPDVLQRLLTDAMTATGPTPHR